MIWTMSVIDVLLLIAGVASVRKAVQQDDRRNERERQYYEQYRHNSD